MKEIYEQGEFKDNEIIHAVSSIVFGGTVAIYLSFFLKKNNKS